MTNTGTSGLFLLLLSSTVSGLGSVVVRNYQYINKSKTWQEAQSFCRSAFYTDLATIYTQSDVDSWNLKGYNAWISLYRNRPGLFWLWTDGRIDDQVFWADDEPRADESCAYVIYNSKRFYGANCARSFFFFCKTGNNSIFIPQSKIWSDAQQYCEDNYDGLATPYSLIKVIPNDFPVWIGLHRNGETWTWGTGLSEYRNWTSGEPGNNSDCVSISSLTKEMATQNCSAQFPFVCFKDNLVLVKENKTWEEALEYCRALTSPYPYNSDLVSVQPGEDHNDVMYRAAEAVTEKVWVGLRFLAGHWVWVNGADMLYSDLPVCPLVGQHCGSLSVKDNGSVETTDCLEKMNFLCYSTW
ncbi:macrophage mannose receptor 1-like [Micropterus dolomieu]|uniref:macrophage mannose receptor 1-like n=1 Tax=Micropterus dolomieu TaxID=147949 RepID=UPI001E8CA413|nr:macrophage mannose receptor 1-like [Micropterus dolomieu]